MLLLFFAGVANPADRHDLVFDSDTWRKYQEELKKRAAREKRDLEEAAAKSARLRKDLLKLYRGIPEAELAPITEAPAQEPVKLPAKEENLDRIYVQLAALQSQLPILQAKLIAEYRAEMDRQDEEEIEMLLMEIF